MNQTQWEKNVNWAETGIMRFSQSLDLDQISTILTQDIIPRVNNATQFNTDILNNINNVIIPRMEKNETAITEINQYHATSETVLESRLNQIQMENQRLAKEINQRAFTNHIHLDYGLPSIETPVIVPMAIEPRMDIEPKKSFLSNLSLPVIAIGTIAVLMFTRKK